MKFGLFGGPQTQAVGASTEGTLGYREYGKYIVEAEKLGLKTIKVPRERHKIRGFGFTMCGRGICRHCASSRGAASSFFKVAHAGAPRSWALASMPLNAKRSVTCGASILIPGSAMDDRSANGAPGRGQPQP
jgi:hypothetical protein